jgi:hypothetical protein
MGLPCGPSLPLPVLATGVRRLPSASLGTLTNGSRFRPDSAASRVSEDLGHAVITWIGPRLLPLAG